MPKVTIVGAGIAGLTAALRLLERGFDVTIFEQNDFLGGKLGAHTHHSHGMHQDYHEHSYHMYLNWYHNFWRIAEEIGIGDRFVAQEYMSYIRSGQPAEALRLYNMGSPSDALQNLFAGVVSPLHMFLYVYSLLDLIGTTTSPRSSFDKISVLAFLNSRGYMEEESTRLHTYTLAKAFAIATFLSDARTYKKFISYGFHSPVPMMWLLKGNTQEYLFRDFERHLHKVATDNREKGAALRIHRLRRLQKVRVEGWKIVGLEIAELEQSPTIDLGRPGPAKASDCIPVDGDVILAIPPGALARLIDKDVYEAAPELKDVRRLRSRPLAGMDVYFRRKLPNVPKGIVVLVGSLHELSFLDTSQLWEPQAADGPTALNVVVSDYAIFSDWRADDEIDLVKSYVFSELEHYLGFAPEDIDRDRCHFQTNVGELLFTNEVGSWDFRPSATCGIENLFLAGDYCKTEIDVVTIEGAVASGLQAAEVVRRRANVGDPIEVLQPGEYPRAAMAALKLLGSPYAHAAKAAGDFFGIFRASFREMFPNN